ncbi:hypothetical protein ACU61A_18245 [Pseudonocardia sichuanensis]
MAAALVTVIAGLVGSAVLGVTAPVPVAQPEPCEQAAPWEVDAQALADDLAGVPGADEEALRQELAEAGFVPGGTPAADPTRPEPGSDLVDELVAALAAVLDTDGDGEVGVTVLGPDPAPPDDAPAAGAGPAAPERTCTGRYDGAPAPGSSGGEGGAAEPAGPGG